MLEVFDKKYLFFVEMRAYKKLKFQNSLQKELYVQLLVYFFLVQVQFLRNHKAFSPIEQLQHFVDFQRQKVDKVEL